jgi:hypothetical protein
VAVNFTYDGYREGIDATNDGRSAQVIQVESSRLMPLLIALAALSMLVAGIAVGFAIVAMHDADIATRQALSDKMRVEGFTRALIAHGIDPYPHVKGEDQ